MQRESEKRKTRRMVVQDSFSIFLVIPEKNGMVRLYIKDISKAGICFQIESADGFKAGNVIDLRLYLNPAFYIPVKGAIVRISDGEVAVEFSPNQEKVISAISRLVEFFEEASLLVIPE